ncbi:MAG: right-handed parallel beta-helix repeat-containing protein, partial [Candidatus Cloacimonetes bacterium]|nr:right-handed parallel beta-helix repeat-containing protein [Candidatus Cloacimonadota bacterium]
MKKNILVLLLSIFFFSLIAIEVPPGAVSGSWSISDSPYIVRGNISIQSGDTLEIDRGVVVYFGFGAQLDVQGRLLVNGTNESRVIFSTLSEQTIWSGIHFDRSSDSKINYATFSNVRNSVTIELDSCSNFELSNCVFSNPEGNTFENNASIISIVNSQYIDIYNNEFSNNNAIGDATNLVNIQNTNRLKFVSNNIFNNNGYSALFHSNSCGALLFEHNEVNNNTSRQATIKIINSITDFTQINGNTIENNTNTGSFGGALSLDGKGFDVSNNIITNNQASQGGGIYLDFHTSSNPNSIIFNNNRIYENTAQYGGGVHVLGKASGAVLFKENDICMNSASVTGGGMYLEGLGDTYDNAGLVGNHITFNSAPAGGGIFALECSSLFIRNCNIVYNKSEGITIGNDLTACNVNAYNTNIWGNTGHQV